ncbi:hypothetical protein KEJ28_05565, partial [Candidatus Bathyarchaeota archaeon]|nr:hypothetical protein [Candidatus Bathyarchaeota archaeon]
FDLKRRAVDVIIEERDPDEVIYVGSERIAPEGVSVINPAFDVTPMKYVTAIICEDGILYKEDILNFRG